MEVVWDDEALSDLETIGEYIARDSPLAAHRVVSYLADKARLLEASPKLGRLSRNRSVRELIASRYPYIIVYEIAGDEVHILHVVHQSQNRP